MTLLAATESHGGAGWGIRPALLDEEVSREDSFGSRALVCLHPCAYRRVVADTTMGVGSADALSLGDTS